VTAQPLILFGHMLMFSLAHFLSITCIFKHHVIGDVSTATVFLDLYLKIQVKKGTGELAERK